MNQGKAYEIDMQMEHNSSSRSEPSDNWLLKKRVFFSYVLNIIQFNPLLIHFSLAVGLKYFKVLLKKP
jgi:hypothetical protein